MAHTTEAKEARATVRIVYRQSDVQKDGTCPFFVCITKQRKRKYVATGLTLHPDYWDGDKERIKPVKGTTVEKRLLADKLKKVEKALQDIREKYEKAAESLVDADELHDAKAVASKAIEGRKQSRRYTVLEYLSEQIETMQRIGKVGYCGVYRDLKNQLTEFVKTEYNKTDFRFDEITVKFCNGFEMFFRERGNTETSLSVRFRTLRTLYNRAIAEGVAKAENYPFVRNVAEKHKFSVGKFDTKTRKRAITRDEVRRIEAYQPTGTATGPYANLKNYYRVERMQRAKDVFLFSFYVGGINFVDLAQLRWHDLVTDADGNQRINYTRQKTGGKFSMKLTAPALAIIESFRALTHHSHNCYIFSILDKDIHQKPNQIKYRLTKILGQVNSDLKRLGEELGIATKLTTYVARHSFASSLRRANVADNQIGQLLGHQDFKQTAVYLDEFDRQTLDAALDVLI
ncbi:tyrosine-type recombinase/integrase [Rudanella paleaurantiibacter]|uniref:Tyrosine-type recombinase/integrase n=1 Tax=Rudanella paleaurantiibacter TaxID=2614655 RepID=A0A7J5U2L2_9BACT|nr:site-specific integrase [Rudanella paleaurantiibacter]KAB7731926.1 tyrosine-type recombinase/integrase [Rudanella paleaurantiibacter]